MENPIKMDDLGVPLFLETSKSSNPSLGLAPTEATLHPHHLRLAMMAGDAEKAGELVATGITRWWFQTFFMFIPIWGRVPF